MNTLKAEKRTMDTKAKRLRREGYVTGNVFGREMEGSLPVKIEKSAVEKLLKTNNKGSQIMLDVDGQSYDVLIKEIQFNPLKGQVVLSIFKYSVVCSLSLLQLYYNTLKMKCKRKM